MSATRKMWGRRLTRAREAIKSGKGRFAESNWNPLVWLVLICQMALDLFCLPFKLIGHLFTKAPVVALMLAVFSFMWMLITVLERADDVKADTPRMVLSAPASVEFIESVRETQKYPACLDAKINHFYANYPKDQPIENKHVLRWKKACDSEAKINRAAELRAEQEDKVRRMMEKGNSK